MTAPVDTAPEDDVFDDAWEMLNFYLRDWGLESLSGDAREMLIEGDSLDVITLKLAETDAYKQRFKANDARRSKGLRVLSPAEYIEVERQYRDIMRRNGLPQGFYDQLDDFTRFMENDISPQELNDRASAAATNWIHAAPEIQQQWERLYGLTPSMAVAAMLDPDRAMPLLERQINTTQIAAEAQRAFRDIGRLSQGRAEELAALGVEAEDARAAFGELAGRQDRDTFLAGLAGQRLTVEDQENELLLGDEEAGARRRRAQQAERNRFSANYLATDRGQGLARNTSGSY